MKKILICILILLLPFYIVGLKELYFYFGMLEKNSWWTSFMTVTCLIPLVLTQYEK